MRVTEGQVTLVGTAHVSKKSVEEVRQTIQELRPQVVCVELDAARLKALRDPEAWQEVPIVDLLREGKGPQLLAQLFLASYQRRIGEMTGVMPGEELLAAVEEAEAIGARVELVDRDVGITLRRAFSAMGFRERMRIAWELMKALVGATDEEDPAEMTPEDIDALLEQDALDEAMRELASFAPSAKTVLIDERDAYIATKTRAAAQVPAEAPTEPTDGGEPLAPVTVAVVGAGHVEGIQRHLREETADETTALERVDKKRFSFWKAVGYGVPLAIVGVFIYLGWVGFQTGAWGCLLDAVYWYIGIVGGAAALGTLLAGGHILSIIASFLAAPLTVLHPALAAGWFAGIVEAWRRTPTVADFQGLSTLTTWKQMRANRVVRVLFVAALCNVTTSIGAIFVLGRLFNISC